LEEGDECPTDRTYRTHGAHQGMEETLVAQLKANTTPRDVWYIPMLGEMCSWYRDCNKSVMDTLSNVFMYTCSKNSKLYTIISKISYLILWIFVECTFL